jgi:hypothetical protein
MEVYNQNIPSGTESLAGALSAPSSIDIPVGSTQSVSVRHILGNQGVLVNSATLTGTGKADFNIIGSFNDPLLIPIGASLDISVLYTGTLNGTTAQLGITFGSNQFLSVQLVGMTSAVTQPPLTPPPSTQPPSIQPTSTQPTSNQPTSTQPTSPPSTQPPSIQPTSIQPPSTQPPSIQPPSTQPTSTQPTSIQPPSTQPTSALTINDLIIVNATSDLDISRVKDCIGCITPTTLVNIRTDSGAFGSVRLTIVGPRISLSRLESTPPFAVFGDVNGDYMGQKLPRGMYTVSAQAFSAISGGGVAGPVKTETFTV